MRRLLGVLLTLLLLTPASGQSITGNLVGTVSDAQGAVIQGVSVMVVNVGTNAQRPGTTNDSGVYSIPGLPPGRYRVDVQQANFKTAVRNDVDVRLNETTRLDITMEVDGGRQTLDVTAAPSLLQADDSSMGTVIEGSTVERLLIPNRQMEGFAQLSTGSVTAAPGSHLSSRGGFNVGGLDEHYMSFFLDGIDNVDPVIRNFSYRPSIDLIQEFKVQQSGYNAEFGRNAGAVINVTTKSGTNRFHGSAWEFLRNDNLDARNYFAIREIDKPSLIRNQFGGTLSGPVVPDRTFFFGEYEGLRQKTGLVRRAAVPTARMRTGDLSEYTSPVLDPQTLLPFAGNIIPEDRIDPIAREVLGAFPLPNLAGLGLNRLETANHIENSNDISMRIDHQLWSSTRLMGRYSYSVARITDPFRTETGGSVNLSNFGQTADRFRTNIGLAFTTVKGQNLVNEFRVGFNRFKQPQLPVNPGTAAQAPLQGYLKTFLSFRIAGFDALGSGAAFDRAVNVYNYIDNVSLVRGNHLFKFGVDTRRYLFNAYNVNPNTFVFIPRFSPASGLADFLLGLPFNSINSTGSPTGNTRKTEFAAYIQDDWKVSPRLTLNYGVRWEFYGRITERVNKQSMWVPDCNCMQIAGTDLPEGLVKNDLNNFAPRFGFAWRPVGERTVLRGSAGIFYDNDMRHNLELATNPPFFTTVEYGLPLSVAGPLSDPFTAGAVQPGPRVNTFDREFRDTYAEHWSLSLQHDFGGFLADAAYVGNHSVKGRRLRNVNQPINGALPYPEFRQIFLFEQAGSSNYNSMQVRVERRFARGFGLTSAYTWGHAIDDRPGQGGAFAQNNYDLRAERGNSDFDVRHRWTVSGIYELPFGPGRRWGTQQNGVVSKVLGGWNLNGLASFQSGRQFSAMLANPVSGSSLPADRPNLVSGVDWKPAEQGPDGWLNPAAFTVPAGTFGSVGRNTLRGPGLSNLDVSLVKQTVFGEDRRLEFRAEFFNALNHPNFALPNNFADLPTFGRISATSSAERQIQFGLKLGF